MANWGLRKFLESYTFVHSCLKGTWLVRFVCWVTTELSEDAFSLSRIILALYIFINANTSEIPWLMGLL